jgi:hypothetical protein
MEGNWNSVTILGDFHVSGNRVLVNCQSNQTHDFWSVRFTIHDVTGRAIDEGGVAGFSGSWEEVREKIEREIEERGLRPAAT